MRRMGIGLQLYTLRSELGKDFEGTIRKVAELGYEGVEFAGYGGMQAEDLKALLDEVGLKAIGSHTGFQVLDENLDGEIKYLQTIGAKYAAFPWLPPEGRGEEQWPGYLKKLEGYGKRFLEAGIEFSYHNHEFEFEVMLGDLTVFEALYTYIPAQYLKVEMDIGWVQYSGLDPIALIQKYAGRLPLLHLKDFRKGEPGSGIDTVELGRGDLPLVPIIQAASDSEVEWLIVEQDTCANPPLEAVAESMDWIRKNYLDANKF